MSAPRPPPPRADLSMRSDASTSLRLVVTCEVGKYMRSYGPEAAPDDARRRTVGRGRRVTFYARKPATVLGFHVRGAGATPAARPGPAHKTKFETAAVAGNRPEDRVASVRHPFGA